MLKIAIIGGGISGLSAAYWLSSLAKQTGIDISIDLFEKESKLGGCIDTRHENGFTIESAPNGFLDSKPYTLKLFNDAGLSNNLLKSNDAARKRFIMRSNKLHRVPESAGSFLRSELISLKGKARIFSEIFIPQKKNDDDESIAKFAKRRLGPEARDYLISPMVSGIFAGDPEKMSLKSSFPVIYNLEKEYGGLFKGLLKKKNKKSGPSGPSGVLTSYKNGLYQSILDLGSKCINTEFHLNTAVTEIMKDNKGFKLSTTEGTFTCDKVIINTPSYESGKFIKPLNNKLSNLLYDIPYAPSFIVGFGFKNEDMDNTLDGFGYLIPANENKKILGALFTSSIFPERVPDNYKLVRVILGGDRNHWMINKNDDELVQISLNEITDILQIKGEPEIIKHFRYNKAIPQYYIGHNKIASEIESISDQIGDLYFGGNILYGIGINDCTKTSWDIVEKIIDSFK